MFLIISYCFNKTSIKVNDFLDNLMILEQSGPPPLSPIVLIESAEDFEAIFFLNSI